MPDDSAEPVNVVLNVEYNQILTLPLTMPNNILWIWVPFNWQNLSFLIMPSLSGGSATLVWEMAANGSVTSSGGRALMSPKAFEIMDPTSSANGSIGVPLTVTGLQPTTAAIVVNLTLALSLQMPASDSSSSFTGYYAMVQQNPTNTASNFVIPFTDTGTASALSAPSLTSYSNYPSSATATASVPTTAPVVRTASSGTSGGVNPTSMTVTVPVTVTGATTPTPPANNYIGVGFILTLTFGGLGK